MEILLAPEAAGEIARRLAEAKGRGLAAPCARLSRDAKGVWRLAIAPAQPGDYTGFVGEVPFAADGSAAEEVDRLLVGWRAGEFVIGEVAEHGCGLDLEIRE